MVSYKTKGDVNICILPDGMEIQVLLDDGGAVVVDDHHHPALLHVHVHGLFPFHVLRLHYPPFSFIEKSADEKRDAGSRSGGKYDLELVYATGNGETSRLQH